MKVLIIDDHTLFREGLSSLLKRRDIEVVDSVGDGKQGIEAAKTKKIDIILLDMRMPKLDGIATLKKLNKLKAKPAIVILTTSTSDYDLKNSLKNGARGYLLKDMEADELVLALHKISDGQIVVDPSLNYLMAQIISEKKIDNSQEKSLETPFDKLTPREKDILKLLAKGQSNKIIARNLNISDGTVKLHVKSILKKLNIHSRVAAAVLLVKFGVKNI
ncbi:MAG: two-component system response regulator NarL [Gammaproteobacteria bacterium]|nr:MAG: two-component system response regulator NarL [Gammaproteobacteria bacterium]